MKVEKLCDDDRFVSSVHKISEPVAKLAAIEGKRLRLFKATPGSDYDSQMKDGWLLIQHPCLSILILIQFVKWPYKSVGATTQLHPFMVPEL